MKSLQQADLAALLSSIKQDSDLCVKCGRCLPACPTYTITQNECESPRGRIALMEGVSSKQLTITDSLQQYLDHCLGCRACEAVCPADVPYGRLIDNMRALQAQPKTALKHSKMLALMYASISKPYLYSVIARILRFYQKSGLQYLLQKFRLLKCFDIKIYDDLLPPLSPYKTLLAYYPAFGQKRGEVGLFVGCINSIIDQQTLLDSIKLLRACGYAVYIPKNQTCCGALHHHNGQKSQADALISKNISAFMSLPLDAILSPVTGCTALLQEYPTSFKNKVYDINQFLQHITWPTNLQLKPLAETILLHTPCSMRYPLRAQDDVIKLLKRIPELEIIVLNSNSCCGAAGAYLLEQHKMSQKLLANTLANIENTLSYSDVTIITLATSNIGCALQFAQGFNKQQTPINVVHPITLVAKQLVLDYNNIENL